DVGSNSVLLLAVAVGADGRARPVDAALETTRLGTRLTDGGALDPAARARTVAAVEALAVRARRAGAERVWAFATAAVRRARARAATGGGRFAASGGTATALAALDLGLICYDARRVHGHVLGRAALQALVGRVAALPPAALAALAGLDPGRAAILPAGAVILERVVEAARASAVTVSDHGVRHAYLRERLAEAGVRADLGELWS